MSHLARLSLANRTLIGLAAILITIFGALSMTQLRQELLPPIEFPQTTVVTVVPGASPELIDAQVSAPIAKAMTNLKHTERVLANSSANISMVMVDYEYGTDGATFEASVRQALDRLSAQLPNNAEPNVFAGSTADIPAIFLTVAHADLDDAGLTELTTEHIVPELEAIEGVRDAEVSGGITQQVVITPKPAQMERHGLTPNDFSEALSQNGTTLPLGAITEDGLALPVQGGTPVTSLAQLHDLPLASAANPGQVTTLGKVASVELVANPPTSITHMDGLDALSVAITATPDGDLVAISEQVNAAIQTLSEDHAGLAMTIMFDQAPFITESISHLTIEGALGLAFAIIVILLFLLSLSSTLVTAISIPLSLLMAFIGLNLGGYSLNMLTLGALTIAIGRVVDDSIVVVENIKRHRSYGTEKTTAIITGVKEVAAAITASTLTTVAVFVPIAIVGGFVGELFRPFALAVTIAMLASLLIALTIVPVLSYWFLPAPKQNTDPAAIRAAAEAQEHRSWLQRGYRPILDKSQRHPVVTLLVAILILIGTGAAFPLLKVDFIGDSGQNMVMVSQELPAGSSLETLAAGAEKVEAALMDTDGVENVMLIAGSGDGSDMAAALGGGATFIVNTDADADQIKLQDLIRDRLAQLDDVGEVQLESSASMQGFGGTVDVQISAANEADLAPAADAVLAALADVEHVTEITSDLTPAEPTLQVQVNRPAALQAGLSELQLLGMVNSIMAPSSIGEATIDGVEYPIQVAAAPAPATADELAALPVPTPAGAMPLSRLASITKTTVPTAITREAGELVATVSLTPAEGELGAVSSAVSDVLDELELPAGVHADIGGLAEQQAEAFVQLGWSMAVAIALVFLLLVGTFRSLIQPLILLVSIPFAATGAIGLLLITGRPLGVSSLIGMLMLIGIVVTNAIVLIDLVNQYRRAGHSLDEAIADGARQRLRPILMTALATIGALLPMALGVTGTSGFISQDLAIVVIGGLISSTALTLVLVPVIYRLFEQRQERRRLRRQLETPATAS